MKHAMQEILDWAQMLLILVATVAVSGVLMLGCWKLAELVGLAG